MQNENTRGYFFPNTGMINLRLLSDSVKCMLFCSWLARVIWMLEPYYFCGNSLQFKLLFWFGIMSSWIKQKRRKMEKAFLFCNMITMKILCICTSSSLTTLLPLLSTFFEVLNPFNAILMFIIDINSVFFEYNVFRMIVHSHENFDISFRVIFEAMDGSFVILSWNMNPG